MAGASPNKRARNKSDNEATTTAMTEYRSTDETTAPTPAKSSLITSIMNPRAQSRYSWPAKVIPVEVFILVADDLSREDVQNMRLVNREFEFKMSGYYFKNVVVPFAPDLFATLSHTGGQTGPWSLDLPSTATTNPNATEVDGPNPSLLADAGLDDKPSDIVDSGLHVFEAFAHHIRAFALSLELNEAELARPPIKPTQQVITTSWGLYRWPLPQYSRYEKVAKLESTADETRRMAVAFSKLTKLKELGLTLDAGLGFLRAFIQPRRKPRVFESSRYEPSMTTVPNTLNTLDDQYMKWQRYAELKQMMVEAGYIEENQAHDAIVYLLRCEHRSLAYALSNQDGSRPLGADVQTPSTDTPPSEQMLGLVQAMPASLPPATLRSLARNAGINATQEGNASAIIRMGLEPVWLTTAQLELLLELKWAHDALVQSFVIAVADNKGIFANLQKFNVARISSSLVHKLCRSNVWDGLEAITEFRLSVIPDWRAVHKTSGEIEDRRLSPAHAVEPVYTLLHHFVGKCKNLRTLSFEWICGGEFGEGLGQRNRYILPAPLISDLSKWTTLRAGEARPLILDLPHVQTLKLKNCWSTPHIFLSFAHNSIAQSLEALELESVSISAPPRRDAADLIMENTHKHWPFPMCVGAQAGTDFLGEWTRGALPAIGPPIAGPPVHGHHGHGLVPANALAGGHWVHNPPQGAGVPAQNAGLLGGAFGGHGFAQMMGFNLGAHALNHHGVPHPAVQPPPSWSGPASASVPTPRLFSWAHILNEITPGQTISQQSDRELDAAEEENFWNLNARTQAWLLRGKSSKKLKILKLKSCGYVLIDDPNLNNVDILPNGSFHVHMAHDTQTSLHEIDRFMLSDDSPWLGKIVDWVERGEKNILSYKFGMWFNGHLGFFNRTRVDPGFRADGFLLHGLGRFSGGFVHGENVPVE